MAALNYGSASLANRGRFVWLVSAGVAGSALGCGFLPISTMSRVGTHVIESAAKPTPVGVEFNGCPAEGKPPDHPLNRHKNRVDEGTYLPVSWAMVARLPWPRQVGYRFRNQFSPHEAAAVARYEGVAVQVTGYVLSAQLQGAESTNCFASDSGSSDYHVVLGEKPSHKERRGIIAEITPRVRAAHPEWTHEAISALALVRPRVRISGWLMLDQLHPEDVGRKRVTLWEVHPIMRLEWQRSDGRWISLDSLAPSHSTAVRK